MNDAPQTSRFRFWLWLIALVDVPQRLRSDWRQCRARQLAEWDKLTAKHKLELW
jgi:hypothetical protein